MRFAVLVLIGALLVPPPSRADCNDRPEQWSSDAAKPWRHPHRWLLWSAGMELGDLSEWSQKVYTDAADSWAVTAVSEGIPPKGGPNSSGPNTLPGARRGSGLLRNR